MKPSPEAGMSGVKPLIQRTRTARISAARWCLTAVTFALLATPYVAGYLSSSEEYKFQGAVDYAPDVQSYFMWMRSSADHAGLPPNLYHSDHETPLFFHLVWCGLGKISRYTGLSITLLYHSSHVTGVLLFVCALWRFIGRFFADRSRVCIAYGVCLLGSGFGWCTLIPEPSLPPILRSKDALPPLSLDLWSADINTFYSLLACPHYAIAMWLLVAALDRLYGVICGDERGWIRGSVFVFLLGFTHVYDLATVMPLAVLFTAAVFCLSRRAPSIGVVFGKGKVLRLLTSLLTAMVPVLFYGLSVRGSPSLASWAEQNVLKTPAAHLYLLGFGLPALMALTYFKALSRVQRGDLGVLFLVTWVITALGLTFAYPIIPFAKRAAEGVHIPIVILAVRCLYDQWIPWAGRYIRTTRENLAVPSFVGLALVLPTTLFLVWNTTMGAVSKSAPFFLTSAERSALDELERRGDKSRAVFAPWQTGNFIPRHTGMMVYAGHRHVTPGFAERRRIIEALLAGTLTEEEMRRVVLENKIGYIWLERRDKQDFVNFPADWSYLRVWFAKDRLTIYEIASDQGPPR